MKKYTHTSTSTKLVTPILAANLGLAQTQAAHLGLGPGTVEEEKFLYKWTSPYTINLDPAAISNALRKMDGHVSCP